MSMVGEKVAEPRKARGLTQLELAERVGFKTKSSIAKIETGVNDVSCDNLLLLSEALNTSVEYLLGIEHKDGSPVSFKYGALDVDLVLRLGKAGYDVQQEWDLTAEANYTFGDIEVDVNDEAYKSDADSWPGAPEELYTLTERRTGKQYVFTGGTLRRWYADNRSVKNLISQWPSIEPVLLKRGVRLYITKDARLSERDRQSIIDYIEFLTERK